MERTCTVYMTIRSESLSPSEISNMLGMTPTYSAVKGQPSPIFIAESQYKGPIAKLHHWVYALPSVEWNSTEWQLVDLYSTEKQLNDLYEIFGEHSATLKTISALEDIWIEIDITWRVDRVNGNEEEFVRDGLTLDKSILAWIVEIGARLDICMSG